MLSSCLIDLSFVFAISYIQSPSGKWDFNAFLLEAPQDSLAQLMLNQKLVAKLGDIAAQREIQRRVAKAGNEARGRWRIADQAWDLPGRAANFIQQNLLHPLGVAAVGHADRNVDRGTPL